MAASRFSMPARPDKKETVSFFNDGREEALHQYILNHPDLETTLRNNPTAIVHAIDTFAAKQRMMIYVEAKIEKSRSLLAEMSPPPKILVEAGTYVGNSAVAWGEMLRSLNGGNTEGVKVFTLELNPDFVKIARDLVELAGLSDVVTVLEGKSGDSIGSLKEKYGVEKIDVLFLDHWEESYLPDLQLCEDLGLLHKGGLILADNTDFPGAPEYLKYVKAGGRGEGFVKYESVSHTATNRKRGPAIVEASHIVEVP